ncbi:MAG: hydrogenobyrinic acid a,c-diamide synthase (glutamine-hydrolyzing) [bacterium]|nr:hydrogenobyrinic acid a,c-diamide synthase (glutamine-hydrolyzing) [bacterium]
MRITISASGRSSGKTTVSIGLCAALKEQGLKVAPFKKGPDYIDPMWLSAAAGAQCHNLDFFMMGEEKLIKIFQSASQNANLNLIEGNMGFYDGLDIEGKDSTSYLSKLLKAPAILVIDAGRMTRGIAPLILGYQQFEPDNLIRGVILNKVAGTRHEKKLKSAIAQYCGIEVLGVLPGLDEIEIKERHLGLMPIKEDFRLMPVIESIAVAVKKYVDLDAVLKLSASAPPLPELKQSNEYPASPPTVRLGIARDSAFTFYYPENLSALQQAGAELIPFNTLIDSCLPEVDGLYFGGGFPEMFLEKLAENKSLREGIRTAIEQGMPVYAECGGLMYLARSISYNGTTKEMVGVLPCDVRVYEKPQGHGYVTLQQTGKSDWFCFDGEIPGHEFHYSQIVNPGELDFAFNLTRGKGVDGKHDGIIYKNVIASYTHLHSVGVPQWASQFVAFIGVRLPPITPFKKEVDKEKYLLYNCNCSGSRFMVR